MKIDILFLLKDFIRFERIIYYTDRNGCSFGRSGRQYQGTALVYAFHGECHLALRECCYEKLEADRYAAARRRHGARHGRLRR